MPSIFVRRRSITSATFLVSKLSIFTLTPALQPDTPSSENSSGLVKELLSICLRVRKPSLQVYVQMNTYSPIAQRTVVVEHLRSFLMALSIKQSWEIDFVIPSDEDYIQNGIRCTGAELMASFIG